MSELNRKYHRFLNRNRDKGIPKLMLWLCIINAFVFLCTLFPGASSVYSWLIFDARKILRGQIWRLFTYTFTFASGQSFLSSPLLGAIISIMFYYWVGNLLEDLWGRLRFNLFYLSGIVLMDVAGLALYLIFSLPVNVSVHYLNLSMFLAVATLMPEQRVYVYMIIPVKMKWLALVDLGVTLYSVIRGIISAIQLWSYYGTLVGVGLLLYALFPLVALLNYFLFFGTQVTNLLPGANRRPWRNRAQRRRQAEFHRKTVEAERQTPPAWNSGASSRTGQQTYRHKCTVCGRTDTEYPDLEFRYCSRCKGYFCYCIDHINNHIHVQ